MYVQRNCLDVNIWSFNAEFWRLFRPCWWIFLLILHETMVVSQITAMCESIYLIVSLSRGSWLLTDANWLFSCNSDRAIYHLWSHYVRAKRSRNTGILRGVSHGRDFEVWPKLSQAILLMSPALVTITANSTSPLSHFNGDFQSWENFFQCQWNTVKSKISLIILSKWNVCLGGF